MDYHNLLKDVWSDGKQLKKLKAKEKEAKGDAAKLVKAKQELKSFKSLWKVFWKAF